MSFSVSTLTKYVNFEVAAGRVSSLIVSHIADVVRSPQKCLSRSVSALLLNSDNANVVTELWFVPRNDRRSVLGDDPQVTRTVVDLRRYLVGLQLLALAATVTWWTDSLTTVRRCNSLDSTNGFVVAGPGEHKTLVEDRFGTAVAHLFLDFVGHVKSSLPDLNLGEMTLEARLRVSLADLTAWLTQNSPGTTKI